MEKSCRKTYYACFIGYGVQAIVNNFLPLLFLTLQDSYQIPLTKITLLITLNFLIQLTVDLVSTFVIDKIGYRIPILFAHALACLGLVALTVLPEVFSDPYIGILTAVFLYAVGGGLLEVLVSPIVEACPSDNKEKTMSLLHSCYCWGHVGVILISTVFFSLFGTGAWKYMALIWALVPLGNFFLFAKAPLFSLRAENEKGMPLHELLRQKIFWVFMLTMLCAGAGELTVSQWASTFAELGLGVSKTVGDLAGPMAFAFLMGTARLIYGKFGDRMNLDRFMQFSSILCIVCYLCIALVPSPTVGLIGCAVCGFSVGIFWPGSFSKASAALKRGGTAVFALLALAGDMGASLGPTLAGFVSSLYGNDLHIGILAATVFPLLFLLSLFLAKRIRKNA